MPEFVAVHVTSIGSRNLMKDFNINKVNFISSPAFTSPLVNAKKLNVPALRAKLLTCLKEI